MGASTRVEWHRRVPGFLVAFLVTFTLVSVSIATDRPPGAAKLLGTWWGPDLGIGWGIVVGFVLGLAFCPMCGLFTYLGGGLITGVFLGGMVGSPVGSGIMRGSAEEVVFGAAALVGIVLGMGLLARRISTMIEEFDAGSDE